MIHQTFICQTFILSRQKSSAISPEITNAYQRTTKLFRFIMQHKQTTKAVRGNQNQIELSETFPKKALDVGATSGFMRIFLFTR
jgi:hypothetical protein